jgi:polyisoprenoid-binding protein YceI
MGQLMASKLQLDATHDAGLLVFDMKSFAADSDTARKYVGLSDTEPTSTQREVSATMLGKAVLDAAHHSTASFTVQSAIKLPKPSARGLAQYQLLGDFTLHGVAHPIQVVAEAEEQNGWVRLRGGFNLRQSQFGIRPYRKAFGAVGVADEVKVYGDLWIAKERQVVTAASAPPNQ